MNTNVVNFNNFIVEDYDVNWGGSASCVLRDHCGVEVYRFKLDRFGGNSPLSRVMERDYSEIYSEYLRIIGEYTCFAKIGGDGHGWVHYTYLWVPKLPTTFVGWDDDDHTYVWASCCGETPGAWIVNHNVVVLWYDRVRKTAFLRHGVNGKTVVDADVYRLRS